MHIKQHIPILQWLPHYKRSWLKNDLFAGMTIGVILIPQGIAYAIIAGLPPIYGLYTAMIPQIVYAILGTSRQLAVGPAAMDSLIVAATAENDHSSLEVYLYDHKSSDLYVHHEILLGSYPLCIEWLSSW